MWMTKKVTSRHIILQLILMIMKHNNSRITSLKSPVKNFLPTNTLTTSIIFHFLLFCSSVSAGSDYVLLYTPFLLGCNNATIMDYLTEPVGDLRPHFLFSWLYAHLTKTTIKVVNQLKYFKCFING